MSPGPARMQLLKVWFLVTGLFLGGALVWGYAPVLIPMTLVGLGLGGLVWGILRLVRRLEPLRPPAPQHPDESS